MSPRIPSVPPAARPSLPVMNVIARNAQDPGTTDPAAGSMENRPGMLEVNGISAAGLEQALEEAIARVSAAAAYHRVGVLVSRTGPESYIVRAHPTVPHGLIRQDA